MLNDWFFDLWDAPQDVQQEYQGWWDERLYEENKEDVD